jgi:hypothetical protein
MAAVARSGGREDKEAATPSSEPARLDDRAAAEPAVAPGSGNAEFTRLLGVGASALPSGSHPVTAMLTAAGNAAVARMFAADQVRRTDTGPAAAGVPAAFTEAVGRGGSGGELPTSFRAEAESRFGADFSSVRVHTDSAADSAADQIAARAFTVGRDIYFASGEYRPGTGGGRRLLAHELTHVVQGPDGPRGAGSWLSSPNDPAERAADAAADAFVSAAGDLDTEPVVGPILAHVSRDPQPGGPAAPTDPVPPPNPPQNRAKSIGTRLGWHDTSVRTMTELGGDRIDNYGGLPGMIPVSSTPAGWTTGSYPTEDAAVAAIRAAGTAGAVFDETGHFVAYHVSGDGWLYSFTFDNVRWFADKPWTAVRFDGSPSANVIVTGDGVALRPENFKSKEDARAATADQALMPGAGADPFAGYRQAFGGANSSASLDMMFYPAMRDNALARLAAAIPQVERDIQRRSSSGVVPPAEVALMRGTAEYLAGLDEEMDQIPKSLPPDPDAYERFWALKARRQVVLRRYPVLARVDAREFAKLSQDEQMAQLGANSLKIREDIDRTRDNVLDGSVNLWKIRPLVDSTIAGLGITDPQARKYVYQLASANESSIGQDILTLFTVVFGLASIVVDGPVGVAVAAGALGLGAADAISQTDQILAEHSAANTALDPAASLLPPEDARSYGWLVVAWLGVIADAAQVVTAVKAVKTAGGIIDRGVEVLAHTDQQLAKELRLAAGAGDATEVISEVNKVGLGRRLSTTIEIDGTMGAEVRVHYHVDSEGRAVVDGVRCGPEATVGVILAHEPVVAMLRRYDGVLGKLRELIDKIRSLAGFPAAGVNPFPAGSQAYESFFELTKLPDVIASRQAALGASLGTDGEEVLHREIEFLENQLVHHQQVVDQMVVEQGVGFIAAAGEGTTRAIGEGMPAIVGNPLVTDASKYYYRVNPGGKPPYLLTRFANADVPALTLVQDGAGWRIAEGALSRTEEAAAMVAGFSGKGREAFEALRKAYVDGVFRIVPLHGVASTGKTFRQILAPQESERLVDILTRTFAAARDPNPQARAVAAVEGLLEHEVTVVRGTDQLRAYNYRLAFEKATGAEAEGDLHHLVPLYMGGGHGALVDMPPGLHDELHELIDGIRLEEGVTLAPSSIQNASSLSFSEGAAVLYEDRHVQLVRLNPDGSFTPVP